MLPCRLSRQLCGITPELKLQMTSLSAHLLRTLWATLSQKRSLRPCNRSMTCTQRSWSQRVIHQHQKLQLLHLYQQHRLPWQAPANLELIGLNPLTPHLHTLQLPLHYLHQPR
jgi:hypothetical protein